MMNSEQKREFEITFFKDYISFGIFFRLIDIEVLKDKYFKVEDKNIKHLIFLNMVKEYFHYMEDFGAICYGIKQRAPEARERGDAHASEDNEPDYKYLIDTLVNYKTEPTKFKNLFKNSETFNDYANALGIDDYKEYFKIFKNILIPEYNNAKEKFAANFKNIKNSQKKLMKLYQNLKHFGFIISKEDILHKSIINNNLEYPAVMLKGKECYKLHILKYNDDFIMILYKNSITLAIFLIEIIWRFIYTYYKEEFSNFFDLTRKTVNILNKKYNRVVKRKSNILKF